MGDTPQCGEHVVVVDEVGQKHDGLVTNNWGGDAPRQTLNVIYVSKDEAKRDPYGQQIERLSSIQHKSTTTAPGRYWESA